jgi:UMF1 family MFS transporter
MEKNHKGTMRAWTMYDWANSVYPLVISSAIFPVYYTAITTKKDELGNVISDQVQFLGSTFTNTVISNYVLAFSFLVICLTSPLLSGIADSKGNKKRFLQFFCYLGSLSTALLYFFTANGNDVTWGLLSLFFASIGYWSSSVFYNSYLPEIADADMMDKVSARGYAMGYIGSSTLLILCLIFIQAIAPAMDISSGLATRYCFIAVGIWWIGFAQIFFSKIKRTPAINKKEGNIFSGFHELQKVWKQIKQSASMLMYLRAFLFLSMGVQTVMLVAAYFGAKLLQLPAGKLIPVILIIQFVGIAGSFLFSWISKKYGNKLSLSIALISWVFICIGAWFDAEYKSEVGFYVLAFFVGAVMGGIQSMSRSTYSKLIPENTTDTASFFSFYDITEKVAMVIGLFSFAWVEEHSPEKGMQNSVLALVIFFIISYFLLQKVNDPRLKARNNS